MTRLIYSWLKDIDNGNIIGTVYLDLRKAFDLVNHELLLYKMKLYNFSENTRLFFKSYLTNRTQLVQIGNTKSTIMEIKSGVPQGSILGPILFIMYINDMVYSYPIKAVDLYADDSTLHKSGTNINDIQTRLQNDLNRINSWCKYNNMALHPGKSKCMLIGPPSKLSKFGELQLTINGQKLGNGKHNQGVRFRFI